MKRDFTYIDDVVECTLDVDTNLEDINFINPIQFHLVLLLLIGFLIGNNNPVNLINFIELIEKELGIKAIKNFKPMQLGDVQETYADISKIYEWIKFKPKISLEFGIKKFINWYLDFYK